MKSKTVEIVNETGLHTRPGNEFVSLAKTFSSKISVENEAGVKVNGTSLLKLLSLGIKKGSKITVYADGEDENEAVDKLDFSTIFNLFSLYRNAFPIAIPGEAGIPFITINTTLLLAKKLLLYYI